MNCREHVTICFNLLKRLLTEESLDVKNQSFRKFFYCMFHFFKYEYRPITIFISDKVSITKVNMLILIIYRFIMIFYIIAVLSPENSKSGNEDVSYSGYEYNNKDLACAIITIFVFEIPFVFIESLMQKSQVLLSDTKAIK